MTPRERIKKILNLEIPDRIAKRDSYWEETIARWHQEGLPEQETPYEYFGTEKEWGSMFIMPGLGLEQKIIEETDRYIIKQNWNGNIVKEFKHGQSWTPHTIKYLVKNRKDWAKYKSRIQVSESKLSADIQRGYEKQKDANKFICYGSSDPFEMAQGLIGQVVLLTNMAQDPEFVKDIFASHTNLLIGMHEIYLSKGIVCDGVWLNGDIAYRNGTLFSPEMYRELLFPYHRKLCGYFRENNMPVIYHTDGDVRKVIPDFIKAGITCLQPLEAKAGMDVRNLKREYGDRLVFMGNIDVRVMSTGDKKKIEDEVRSKILAAKHNGGYIYHSDHSVPPSVSFDSYKFVMELVEEYGRY